MILNERQYKITKKQVDNFSKHLIEINKDLTIDSVKKKFLNIQKQAIESEIENLNDEINEYEQIKSGNSKVFDATTLNDLPLILIKARIAHGLSQKQLADKLGLKEQQIQRYESELYASASLTRLVEIANSLDLKISENAEIQSDQIDWMRFPVEEMYKRNWFDDFKGSLNDAIKNRIEITKQFVLSAIPSPQKLFTHRHVRSGSIFSSYALYAWQCRIMNIVNKTTVDGKYNKAILDNEWFNRLLEISVQQDSPAIVGNYLSKSGIFFVIEPHLPQTFLDGAAMMLPGNCPVVALTLRYDRLDNFWYVLIHELIHIKEHLKSGINCFFDDFESVSDEVEFEADQCANNFLIPSDIWETAVCRYARTEASILTYSKDINRSPSIIAGRIRRDANNYTIFNNLIGNNSVRKLFPDVVFNY